MHNKKILFILSLIILIVSAFLLISGSPLLVKPLTENSSIPMGTFITWFGMIALPLSIYLGINKLQQAANKRDQYFALLFKVLIVLAVLWVPISYALAGNLSFTFSEKATFQGGQSAMKIFWSFNIFLVIAPLTLWIVYGLLSFLYKRKILS